MGWSEVAENAPSLSACGICFFEPFRQVFFMGLTGKMRYNILN